MSTLRISLLGEIRVYYEDSPSAIQLTPRQQLLLAYLVLQRQTCHPRLSLMELFWAGYSEKRAQRCLRTSLWRLRRALKLAGKAASPYLVSSATHDIRFNCDSDYWLDVEQFEQGLGKWRGAALTETAVQQIEVTLGLFKGPLLNGYYDDWVILERERLENLYINSLTQLMHYYKAEQAYEKALTCGQRILRVDQLREEIHREIMHIYAATGQRTLAIRQYDLCATLLEQELSIEPMPETQYLHQQILTAVPNVPVSFSAPAGSNPYKEVSQRMEEAMLQFEKAYEHLQQATALFYSINKQL